ncbi:peptidase inhibitor family I36 protein [Saccharothrix sp. AJ9571]|nr:peptidase inhibitor family I36 protein [Saccharothrix sp. AJ9571]
MRPGFWAALGLATVVAIASGTPAQAASPVTRAGDVSITAWSDCPSGWLCLWEHANGQGRMARFQSGTVDLRDYNLQDQASSLWNRTEVAWCAYSGSGHIGDRLLIGAGQRINLADVGWDNKIDSVRRGGC